MDYASAEFWWIFVAVIKHYLILTDDLDAQTYPYGITSLADKRDFLQKGDIVKFQVAVVKSTKKERAVNIAAIRKYIRARVDSIKDKVSRRASL